MSRNRPETVKMRSWQKHLQMFWIQDWKSGTTRLVKNIQAIEALKLQKSRKQIKSLKGSLHSLHKLLPKLAEINFLLRLILSLNKVST